jgi:hypothetical protein
MKYEILDNNGSVVNIIVADEKFVQESYPGHYREVSEPPIPEPEPSKTEEEKLADAAAALVAKLIADGVLKQA